MGDARSKGEKLTYEYFNAVESLRKEYSMQEAVSSMGHHVIKILSFLYVCADLNEDKEKLFWKNIVADVHQQVKGFEACKYEEESL